MHFSPGFPSPVQPGKDGYPGKTEQQQIGPALFDLETDPSEKNDLYSQHPDVVKRIEELAEQAREDLGDSATKRKGKNVRPAADVQL